MTDLLTMAAQMLLTCVVLVSVVTWIVLLIFYMADLRERRQK